MQESLGLGKGKAGSLLRDAPLGPGEISGRHFMLTHK